MRLLHHRSLSGRLKVTIPFNSRATPMSNSLLLKDKMDELIGQHLPPLWETRRQNLARLTAGLYRAEHVHLSAVADEIPGSAKQTSKTRRLRRFLANEDVDPDRWYRPVATDLRHPFPGQLILQNYLRIAPKVTTLVVLFRVSACLSADRIARKERDR